MDPQRQRIQEDLRGLLAGEVRCDDVFLQLYATDASVYRVRPLGVIRPKSTDDVVAAARYCHENQITLHARGAGSGLAGESLGPGLIIDFSVHMRRILAVGDDTVRLQPGVVHERLNTALAKHGRTFGPDPSNSVVTTMGSVVAIDASGRHWLKYGSARRHVKSLRIVLPDGTRLDVGREPLVAGESVSTDERLRELVNSLVRLLRDNRELLERHRPRSRVNRSGYEIFDVLREDSLDLAGIIAGSEGTLALITEITLATQPIARHSGMAMLLFERMEYAARAVHDVVDLEPIACDLMDRRHLGLAREIDPRYETLIPIETEAMLLVEVDGDDPTVVREKLRKIIDQVKIRKALAFEARQALSPENLALFNQLPREVTPLLHRIKGATRPLPFVEDFAVPPEVLPEALVEVQNVLKRHQVTASLYGHAGHGQMHVRPFLDLADPAQVGVMARLASDLYDVVLGLGGTISGEHGDGISRTPFLAQQYGPACDVFREVKRIFDPRNILNPGKIAGGEPQGLTENLRPTSADSVVDVDKPVVSQPVDGAPTVPRELISLQLAWSPEAILQSSRSCNGCGVCRTQSPNSRMCPIFRFAPAEEASPRAKANLMLALLTGGLDPSSVKTDEFKAVADLCVNCQQCRLECPAGVDIPRLMLEAKAAYVSSNGMRLAEWLVTRYDLLGAFGSLFSPIANWLIANRTFRWMLEKTIGIAHARKLPTFASRVYMRRAKTKLLTKPARSAGRKVLFFVDTYANYHDPQLAEALVAVFEHNGISVFVPPNQGQSGIAMISLGAGELARKTAQANIAVLADAVRQGYTIVTAEPSAALCLKIEYPQLVDDEEARLVAANTQEACHYLWTLHAAGKLQLDFKPVNAVVGYHQPCHVRALEMGSPGENLLRLVPGLTVTTVDKGCSGMAGSFGLKKENFRNSIRAGWDLISTVRESDWTAGTTECSACKMQMEQGTSKPTIHPMKLLALSYRLMPELNTLLATRSRELTVT
ncbi:MAG: anaerobic glycerol-3-phosphate dehydrogenase subunit C [Planctomycetia bacterium]|nr:anaerobic glycerol-3-phosphate dehydrogenase subunit C [Planctomycetia bacterium]